MQRETTTKHAAGLAVALGLTGVLGLAVASPPEAPEAASAAEVEVTKEVCLECHGPFDDLTERTAEYQPPAGEPTSPHRYVPHEDHSPAAIPECLSCHQRHSDSPTPEELASLEKPTVNTCFKCHHIEEFVACSACHR